MNRPDPTPNPDPQASPSLTVTPADRQKMVSDLQRSALELPDPLAANMRTLWADLLGIVHTMSDRPIQALKTQNPGFIRREIDTYLKVAREIERFARIDKELTQEREN